MAVSEDLRSRIDRLSPRQRQQLMARMAHAVGQAVLPAQLVAYAVPRDRLAPPDADELRDFLRALLPEHMVPAVVVVLEDGLPRLPNGKLDLDALPDPAVERAQAGGELVEPRTETERVLASIWRDVLGVDVVGVHDNFFELGGDSILSIRVVARAQQAGLAFEPDQLFRHQTLKALAAVARAAASEDPQRTAAPQARADDAEFPDAGLTPAELDRFLGSILP